MCVPSQDAVLVPSGPVPHGAVPHGAVPAGGPSSAGEAAAMVLAGLRWLATADVASIPVLEQADCLRDLERAASVHTAARARVLAAFTAQAGYEDDGHGSPRTWLKWQTRVTGQAAATALASMRRLKAHPAVAQALAAGDISASWARQVTDWTELLPEETRGDADLILLTAAAGGADLADLASLAQELRCRLARPDSDKGDGFEDRSLRLATTLGGAGRLYGDLTPRAAAALQAVLDALGKRAGPEDLRSRAQRDHDAMEEACRRLVGSGCLPDRAGQPTQIQLHLTLDELARGTDRAVRGPSWPGPAAGPGDDCDAAVTPVVTGRVDHDLLDKLAASLTTGASQDVVRDLLLANAVALLSGPAGLASQLRGGTLPSDRTLPKPAASISLPLDVGAVCDTIPAHLRRAVILRDKHCAAPGCDQPPPACQVHHIVPRSRGGPTALNNLLLLCSFHHLILVHRWGWTISLGADGTTTATNPDGTRVLRSHAPPAAAA